ncbi:MAG TPA: hypothetical protein VGQ78_06570 [Vicinamibacteria bacterium]|nr:hypothetical protein [Vicinamibacteria bacterium]
MNGVLPTDKVLTVALFCLAVYFSVLIVRAVAGYVLFLKVRRTPLLTWPARPPAHFPLVLVLGVVSAALAVLNASLDRPFHHVYSQGAMAFYFILLVPLSARIDPGFYGEGVWADTGFLRYGEIGRLAFREKPEIVLILLSRGGHRSFRLAVPPDEYGAVRKVLEEKIRAREVNVEQGILGL